MSEPLPLQHSTFLPLTNSRVSFVPRLFPQKRRGERESLGTQLLPAGSGSEILFQQERTHAEWFSCGRVLWSRLCLPSHQVRATTWGPTGDTLWLCCSAAVIQLSVSGRNGKKKHTKTIPGIIQHRELKLLRSALKQKV